MQAQGNRAVQRRQDFDVINVKRNPYLVDYEKQRRLRRAVNEGPRRLPGAADTAGRRPGGTVNRKYPGPVEMVNERSRRTTGEANRRIECCYKEENGSFTEATYDSLISLLAWLTDTYNLDTSHILRHYDCGGKKCPLYYTENEEAWEQLKADVAAAL